LNFLQITFDGTFAFLMLHRSSLSWAWSRNKDRQATQFDISPKPPMSTLTIQRSTPKHPLWSRTCICFLVRTPSIPMQGFLKSHLWTLSLYTERLPIHRAARRVACCWSFITRRFCPGKPTPSSLQRFSGRLFPGLAQPANPRTLHLPRITEG